MSTFAVSDFVLGFSGLLNTVQNDLIHSASKSLTTTVNRLIVEMREAPTGQDAIFEFFREGNSIGTVTVADGAVRGETVVSETFNASEKMTVTINQVGNTFVGKTATFIMRAA